jgi:hypothetical protein
VYAPNYNAPNERIQRRMLAALEKDPPPLVWAAPAMRHDGGPASLRSYRVYRWLMDQGYRYWQADGLQFLLHPARARDMGLAEATPETDLDGLSRLFAQPDLQAIPVSWGRSFDTLAWRFQPGEVALGGERLRDLVDEGDGWFRVAGPDPLLQWRLRDPLPGSRYDFIMATITCKDGSQTPWGAQLFWAEAGQGVDDGRAYPFRGRSGEMLFPMGAHPRWLFATAIDRVGIRFDLEPSGPCSVFRPRDVTFLTLVH